MDLRHIEHEQQDGIVSDLHIFVRLKSSTYGSSTHNVPIETCIFRSFFFEAEKQKRGQPLPSHS